MKARQINNRDVEIILPQDIYTTYLMTINGISFTRREIDIISCILSGRIAKKIASFLSIAPKTVEHHIRNVMLKLGCQSQEGIRDFIEKSGKFTHVKKYYASLLIQDRFELELNKIASLGIEHKPSCLIVYENEQQEKLPLIRELEKHLKLIGIKTLIEARDRHQSTSSLINKIELRQVNYIIYSLPITFIEQPRTENNTGRWEDSDFICATNKYAESVIILLLDRKVSVDVPNSLLNCRCIDLTEYGNYYFLAFETLKKVLPGITLDKNISEFKLQYEMLNDPSSSPIVSLYSLPIQTKTEEVVSWNLPRQDHAFVGREKLLGELEKELHAKEKSDRNEPVVVSVCAGLGGVGKTQLALQYIHHSQHPYTLRAWFTSENLDQLKQQYIEFAKILGYKEEKPSIKTVLPYIKGWFLKNPGWLLVYDNVNSYEEVKEFLPENSGSIILTTRQQKWPSGFKMLDIDVMNEEESIGLIQSLIKRRIIEREKEPVKNLVKILGCLPLALAQASAYIRQNQIMITEYLEFYRNHEQKLLADNTFPEGTSSLPVAINWNVSLEAIVKEAKATNQSPLALDLLSACAYLAPERIPHSLLLTWFKECHANLAYPELIFPKLVGQLWQYSMIHREENGDITVHRLVQAAVHHQHTQALGNRNLDYTQLAVRWYDVLLKSVHAEFTRKTQVLEDEVRQKNLLPHLQVLLNHYKQMWTDAPEFRLAYIINDIGTALFLIGEIKDSVSYYRRALQALEQHYRKDHIELTFTLDHLARAYRYLRHDVKQAKMLHERSLKIKEQHYGKDHVELALTIDYLGRTYRYLGDAKQAKRLHERALKIKEQYYGKGHLEIAYTLEQLGNDYRDLGDAKQAIELYERTLKIKEQYYGNNHQEIAKTLTNLGRACTALNNAKRGKLYLEKALNMRELYYGMDHPEVAETLLALGNTYKALKNTEQSQIHLKRALRIREQFFGQNHTSTMEVGRAIN